MTIYKILETMDYGPALEDAKPALTWLESYDRRFGHFINGTFTSSNAKKMFKTANPTDQSLLASCVQGSVEDVQDAVTAAREAQPGWAALKGTERARYLYAIARHLQKHHRRLAVLETLDNGKTIRESRDIDVPLATRHFYYHAGWAANQEDELKGYQPVGVCGQIIPWNFPLLMLAWKIAPAIAMGNTVVLKPAEQTPLTALAFAEICQNIGLPPGVVNIVMGDGVTGSAIVEHPDINKIAFTGSTEVGRTIRKATAASDKSLTLELGGKSPFLVFDDADLDSAVEGVVDSIWFNQGQVCCAGSRLLLQEGIADSFLKKLKHRLTTLRIGNPLDKCVDMGPIVSKEQLSRIDGLVTGAAAAGAEVTQSSEVPQTGGNFFPPTLICNVEPTFEIVQEEVFGPVLVSMTFRTPDEAVLLANHTRYGLAGSVWSENINLALDITSKLNAGVVWVNSANQFDAAAEFGGIKESGYGREGGKEGLLAYLKTNASMHTQEPKAKKNLPLRKAQVIDRTAKLYIGGRQVRPDGGHSYPVISPDGNLLGHAAQGNRKDIRNAVEAAVNKPDWTAMHGHERAQILYYIAENLDARKLDFSDQLTSYYGRNRVQEVEECVDLLFRYAGYADKFDGAIRNVNAPGVVLKMNNPIGVIGVICPDERPLVGLMELVAPALAMGNRTIVLPSRSMPLAATNFYQILDTSDVPSGTINIVTGNTADPMKTLAEHNNVNAVWCANTEKMGCIKEWSVGNLKRTWSVTQNPSPTETLRHATQTKSVWIPFGE